MSKAVKSQIYQMLEGTEDESVLNQLKDEVAFYASKKDIIDDLTTQQVNELNEAIKEADNKETITWEDFKKEMNEWSGK